MGLRLAGQGLAGMAGLGPDAGVLRKRNAVEMLPNLLDMPHSPFYLKASNGGLYAVQMPY